jgi:hypothetical protein
VLLRRRGEFLLGAQDKALLRAILHARVGTRLAYPCSLASEDARVSVVRESPIPTKTELSAINYRHLFWKILHFEARNPAATEPKRRGVCD